MQVMRFKLLEMLTDAMLELKVVFLVGGRVGENGVLSEKRFVRV
jgi:hypothetical protein